MAIRVKDKEKLNGIADTIDAAITGIFAEQEQISKLSDARSIQKRQAVIANHISTLSGQSQAIRDAAEEMSVPAKPKEDAPSEDA